MGAPPSTILSHAFRALAGADLVFLLIHIVPGDPVEQMLGEARARTDRAIAAGLPRSANVHSYGGIYG